MDKGTRSKIQRATQVARRVLEDDYREQLEGTYDILLDGKVATEGGAHLTARQNVVRAKIVASLAHRRAVGRPAAEAVSSYLRELAFTTINQFAALKMLEARALIPECVSSGDQSRGFREFSALAPGLVAIEDRGYRLYLESVVDESAQEIRVLFDRRESNALLWPRRQALHVLLATLNSSDLAGVWEEDETAGWIYQYFNGDDERAELRDSKRGGSPAPRNSRELAIRNQFFTPRYVVEFLVANTLGRLWCGMRRGSTSVATAPYLVDAPAAGSSADRELKDPRDIRLLDPACGSGHFLLYSFDVFMVMYREAWEDPGSPPARGGRTLRQDYPDLESLQRDLPALVLHHNLFGVDIDPRALQIAEFALWLRAQRAWAQAKISADRRPAIARVNLVVAESLPNPKGMADEFASSLRPQLLATLFRAMVSETGGASVLGTLLRAEATLREAVRHAHASFLEASSSPQQQTFPQFLLPDHACNPEDAHSDAFFNAAEEEILAAVKRFSVRASDPAGFRKRLFADDVARGVAFLDLIHGRYDVVLTNPPFGLPVPSQKVYLKRHYPSAWTDMFNAFLFRARELAASRPAIIGAVVPDRVLVAKKSTGARRLLLEEGLHLVVSLGPDVMDRAAVHAVLLVTGASPGGGDAHSCVLADRVSEDRAEALLRWTSSPGEPQDFSVFRKIPGSPFAIDVPPKILDVWQRVARLEPDLAVVATGGKTFDDFRFLRAWWEVPEAGLGQDWLPVDVGGDYQCGFSPPRAVQLWAEDGREMRARALEQRGTDAQVVQSRRVWFRPSIAYPYTSSIGFGPRLFHGDSILSTDAVAVVPGDPADALWLLGALLSSSADLVLRTFGTGRKTENASVKSLPVERPAEAPELESATRSLITAVYRVEARDECSRAFYAPGGIDPNEWLAEVRASVERIERVGAAAFGLVAEEVSVLYERLCRWIADRVEATGGLAAAVSFRLGLVFGRWQEREPKDALETSWGEMYESLGRRCPTAETQSRLAAAPMDPGSPLDIVTRLLRLGPSATDAASSSCPGEAELAVLEPEDLRAYMCRQFFGQHIRRYRAGARAAPIYWQLATPTASYSVWLYYHALTHDTLFSVLRDLVEPKVLHEERKLTQLMTEAGPTSSRAARDELSRQEALVAELRVFRAELELVAPLWKPDLGDGVLINCSVLWRLVSQDRSWQEECRRTWDRLVAGEFDWSRLSIQLWPERVVGKCLRDRSLAVAHGLESTLWEEANSGGWTPRDDGEQIALALIEELTSPAVHAALGTFLDDAVGARVEKREGAAAVHNPRRGGRGRSTSERTPVSSGQRAELLSDEGGKILGTLERLGGSASKREIIDAAGLSEAGWSSTIQKLIAAGTVSRSGRGRGTRYRATADGGSRG